MMLAIALSGTGANDSENVPTDARTVPGLHTDADALITYGRRMKRASFGASGRSVLRYDARARAMTPVRQQGAVEFSMTGSQRQFRASQSVSYSPYYQFGAVADVAPSDLSETALSHGDFANSRLSAYGFTTDIALTQAISRRSTLSMAYNRRTTTFGRSDLDLRAQTMAMHISHRLTRYVSLRTGYGYQVANVAVAHDRPARNHDVDLGLDYSRALSFSRRTTLSFSSGSSTTTQDGGTAFRLTGDATLTRQIGRTWNARVAANRRVQMLEGFTQPVLADAITATLGGGLNRYTAVSSSLGFTSGTVGVVSTPGHHYANWTGGAGLRLTLSRRSAVEAQYFYYVHRFDQNIQLPPGLMSGLSRHGIRVGLSWNAPLVR